MSAPAVRKIACLSMDVEPDLRDPNERIRLFEDESRLLALSSVLKRYNVPLTCFVVMKHAGRHAQGLAALAKEVDAEFAVHSFSHNQRAPATVDEVNRSWDAYCDLWNRAPRGYRTPNCVIDTHGLRNIAERGFVYDSSIVPSIRFDEYGYNNLHLSREPFVFVGAGKPLVEFPIACFAGLRLPIVLSYVKLFGMTTFRTANRLLSLPDVVSVYFHPYDLYVADIADNILNWKKYAHLRNATRGLKLLADLIEMLRGDGYQFMRMESLAEKLTDGRLPVRSSLATEPGSLQFGDGR